MPAIKTAVVFHSGCIIKRKEVKAMTKGKSKLRILALALTICMVFTFMPMVSQAASTSSAVDFTEVDPSVIKADVTRDDAKMEEEPDADVPADDEQVRVIIILDEKSVIEKGYSTKNLPDNRAAVAYSDKLETKQVDMAKRIADQALNGQALDIRYNFTIGVNGIATTVQYGQISDILAVKGVKDVHLEEQYEVQDDQVADPNTAASGEMVGSYSAWANGYTGAGSRIAIIDTGLDTDHPSFTEEGYLYGLAISAAKFHKNISDYNLLTKEEIAEVLPHLNALQKMPSVTADDLYVNQKIAYGFNYIDGNLNINHDAASGDHGSHVSGIATANKYIPYQDADGDTYFDTQAEGVVGIAPDAQILTMRVFSNGWGAYESDYMAAIEDAIWLRCDSVNLSLGSSSAGKSYTATYNDLFTSFLNTDTTVVFSAGNAACWGDSVLTGTGLTRTEDVRTHTGGSSGSYTHSFTVASVDNTTVTGIAGIFNDVAVVVNDRGGEYGAAPFESLDTSADHTGTEYPYVFLGNPETKEGVYAQEADFAGLDLTGKIVLISRGGDVSFFEKANRACAAGAAGVVVYNNVDGTINMDLTGYTYDKPAISITLPDMSAILAASTQNEGGEYGGKVLIKGGVQIMQNTADAYKPSSFTSWGTTEDLGLKPEIIAPGGNIWSSVDGGVYGTNSGTSMAAPSVTGSVAVVAQYIKENKLNEKTGLNVRTLAIALLMGTAKPLTDSKVDLPYSVRAQGAGLTQIYEAVTSPAYLLVGDKQGNDGKVKMEFRDDPQRTGVYSDSFSINNLTDKPLSYTLDSLISTMAVEVIDGQEYMSKSAYRLNPQVTFETAAQTVYVYDLNGDGKVDAMDAKVLLQIANGTREALDDHLTAQCDFDADGAITTADAQLYLAALQGDTTYFDVNQMAYQVPANGSIQVKATIALSQEDKAYLDEHYANGCYVEGYLYTNSQNGDEKQMSIPVFGYYGNWSEPSMFDHYTLLENYYGGGGPRYVTDAPTNYLTFRLKGSTTTYNYQPNIYAKDDEYIADRNAMANTSNLYGAVVTMLRNTDNLSFIISNADTGEVYQTYDKGSATGAYYVSSSSTWTGTSSNASLGWQFTDANGKKLEDGTRVKVTARAVPELYWDRFNKAVKGELAEGAYWTTTFTMDNTKPEATGITYTTDAITGARSLAVTVKDNRYVAAVKLISEDGTQLLAESAVNQTEKNKATTVNFDLSKVYSNSFKVSLFDYAGNNTVYEVSFGGEVQRPATNTMLHATLPDSKGQWFADIDADDLTSITTKNPSALNTELLSAAKDAKGTLYVATNEKDADGYTVSSLYTMNESTYAMTKIGTSELGYTDMSWAPTVKGGSLMATYGRYVLVVDTTTGTYGGVWDLTSQIGSNVSVVGLSYLTTTKNATYGDVDIFALLCNNGTIYQTAYAFDSAAGKYTMFAMEPLAQVSGITGSTFAGSSMYCTADGKLFVSGFTGSGSKLSYIDLSGTSAAEIELGTINSAPISIYGASAKTGANGASDLKGLAEPSMEHAVAASTRDVSASYRLPELGR